MTHAPRSRFRLTPLRALVAFAAIVAIPMLYASRPHTEAAKHYGAVIVHAHDTLWTLAAAHAKPGADIQETVDEIAAANHLTNARIVPGNRLRIPY